MGAHGDCGLAVKTGPYWVRFEIFKNAKLLVSAALVIFYNNLNLGSFLQIYLYADASKGL